MSPLSPPDQTAAQSVADSHLPSDLPPPPLPDRPLGVHELASGVDALYLSGRCVLDPDFLEQLAAQRRFAEDVRLPMPFALGGEAFSIRPHGWGKYRYCLDHEGLRLGVTPSSQLPAIRVQPRAELLHVLGPAGTVAFVEQLLGPLCQSLTLSTARLDLFVDVEDWSLSSADRDLFVCRADARRTYELAGRFTGFEFGSRKTKTICARIYDKTADIAAKGNDWWLDVWGDHHRPGATVHRVEFEFARPSLKEFGVNSPAETLAGVGDLWRYATAEWLTHRRPTADATRSRWPLSAPWITVQDASLAGSSVDLERIRAGRTVGSLRRLVPALTGYLVGAAVLLDTEQLDDTLSAVQPHLRRYERTSRHTFPERVTKRRSEVGR